MTFEILIVTGVILGILSVPSMVSAYIDGRSPRRAAIIVLISGGLIVTATQMAPGGFDFADVPRAFATVIRAIID